MIMKTVNVSELEGEPLDWATGVSVGEKVIVHPLTQSLFWNSGPDSIDGPPKYRPSTDWSQGGPLIQSHWLMIDIYPDGETEAKAYLPDGSHWTCFGPTPLVAVCRAIVGVHAKKSTIEVPEELT